MKDRLLTAILLSALFAIPAASGQVPAPASLAPASTAPGSQPQQPSSGVPVIRLTSTLVFLDVTVLDKKGRPVVTGLSKDDFTITEDHKPEKIFSFEAPETHVMARGSAALNPDGKAPATIFVLDLLNSSFSDFAYIRYSVRNYLQAQPAQLKSPAELMVIGNESLELLQGFTTDKKDLLYALDHLPAALPYKQMNGSFFEERFGQSIDALQQIALENKGIPGRKNIVWVGHGGPGLNTNLLPGDWTEGINQYVHAVANMLVDARISLFVIYPGLPVEGAGIPLSAMDSDASIGDSDPFAGNINFGVFVDDTGGKLFFNRNDVDAEMKQSQQLGSEYYTLTYQPQDVGQDGKFRHIRVTLRDPKLRVVTKAGYYAPDEKAPANRRESTLSDLAEAVRSSVPFQALEVNIADTVRHPDAETAELTLRVSAKNLNWQAEDDGKDHAVITLIAASMSGDGSILASKLSRWRFSSQLQDPGQLAKAFLQIPITVRVPKRTTVIRVAVAGEAQGRIGTAEITRKSYEAAPALPSPTPQLVSPQPAPTSPVKAGL